jgi:membrane protein YdbS with pleckstrin-like domain
MPYPSRLLNEQESVAVDLHPHWWFFAQSVSSFTALGVLWLFVFGQDNDQAWLTYPIGVLALAALVWAVVRYLKWRTTYFVITSDRVIFRHGVLGRGGIEIPLERVNNVNFKQSLFERMIGAGDLLIESGGQDGQQMFSDIPHPDKIVNLIHMQMEDNQKRSYGGIVQSVTDIATQLEKLEGLRDRGTISASEFEAEKVKLLGQ